MVISFIINHKMENDDIWTPKCPECGSPKVDCERQSEYTGGGYADYWDEFQCRKCEFTWRSDKKSSYF